MENLYVISVGMIEYLAYISTGKKYPYMEAACCYLSTVINGLIFKFAVGALVFRIYLYLYSVRIFDFSVESNYKKVAVFFVVDFGYYLVHRVSHAIRIFWVMHEVHHYPNGLTTLAGTSQSFVGMFFKPYFLLFFGLALLGIPPGLSVGCYMISLLYQNWIHTDFFPLLGPIEFILNTPNLHRIHHSLSREHVGKNYGGVLMVFDQMFGTYLRVNCAPDFGYGTIPKFEAKNIFSSWVREFHEWKIFLKQVGLEKSLRRKLKFIFAVMT